MGEFAINFTFVVGVEYARLFARTLRSAANIGTGVKHGPPGGQP